MEHCRFCQANLEPGAQRCSQCGQFQSASLTDTPMQPAAPTPLLSLEAHSQDKLPDTPHSAVRVQGQESEPLDAQEPKNSIPSGAPTPLSTASVDSQDKLPDTPTPEVPVPGKGSETPRTQERASEGQPGVSIGETETRTQQCPACRKALPAQAHFCPACGHPVDQPAQQPDAKNVPEVTITAAATHQEDTNGTTLPTQQASPNAQGTASEQPRAPAGLVGTATPYQERTDSAPAQAFPSAQQRSPHAIAEQQGTTPHEAPVAEQESHSIEESATEAKGDENKEGEEEGPVATFRKRRIAFKTLSRPLQVLLLLTLAQIGVVALLLATQNLPQPRVSSGVIAGGQFYVVPLAAFIVLAVSLTAGTWFALAGALRVHWGTRMLVIALATGLLAYSPILQLTTTTGLPEEQFVTEVRVRWIQLALLALFWVWATGVSVVRWRARRKGAVFPLDSRPWHGWVFGLAVAPILLYYALDLVIWRAYAIAGFPGEGSALFLFGISSPSSLLPLFLPLLLYWSSTDLLEWSETVAKSVITVTRRVSWLLVTVTTLAAVGMLVNVLRLEGRGIVLGLVLFAVLAGIVALVVHFARIHSDWPAQIPPLVLLLGAILLYLLYDAPSDLIGALAIAHGLVQEMLFSLSSLVMMPVLLIALTTGLVLVARGRLGKPKQGAIGLFLVMVTLLSLVLDLPNILSAAGLSVAVLQQPYHLLRDMVLFATVGALIWISYLLVRQRPLREAASTLTSVFFLLAGLQAIDWLNDLTNGINALGALSPLLLAGLFVLTVLWDFVTSGEQVTNTDNPAFPREGRILLYLGYTLVATSLLLYIGSLRDQATGAPAPNYLSIEIATPVGLFLLGSPMVVLTFLLSVGRRLPHPAVVAAPQPAGQVSSRTTQFGIVGSGVVAFVLVMIFLISSALPRLVHANQVLLGQATYTAKSPGPGCDTGGAIWTIEPDAPINLRCLPTGTQITAIPGKIGLVDFLHPEMNQVQNYRVSVHIDFSSAPHVCVGILTRASGTDYYENAICADGAWELGRSSDKFTALAYGQVALARAYTLEATTDGPKQSLTINGIEKASVTDATWVTGSIELGVLNNATSTKSVVLSDYSYTPLPNSTSIATPPSYIPPSAVLAFRDPLTSPGR